MVYILGYLHNIGDSSRYFSYVLQNMYAVSICCLFAKSFEYMEYFGNVKMLCVVIKSSSGPVIDYIKSFRMLAKENTNSN